jgi:hypothetical protein
MPRTPIDLPPGLKSDDTAYAASPGWVDGSNVRFRLGRAQTIGGWESLMTQALSGVCRAVLAWTDNNSATLNIAFGTHTNLQLWQGGGFYDITPFGPVTALPADPLTVANGSAVVTVRHPAHGLSSGAQVAIAGAASVGRITPNGTFPITVMDANTYAVTFSSAAAVSKTLGANPFSVLLGSPVVTVTETGHNITSGASVTFSGAAAVGGITPNGTFAVTVLDANTYSFSFTASASSTASGGGSAVVATVPTSGGGAGVVATPQQLLPPGAADGTGTSGYGTGAYGTGGWGQPSAADYFPRTWSLAAWGQKLLASPRNGGLYEWSNVTSQTAVAVTTAPTRITQMLVSPQRQVFALGCTQENGLWNPLCLRHSGIGDETQWSTDATSSSTAREYVLPGGGRIVGGKVLGRYLLVWTTQGLFLGTYVGQISQVWRFDKVGDKCGLIGPNAAAVLGSTAFWISPDLQFHSYSVGGVVAPVACPIRQDFADNLAASQADKITASTIGEFSEVRWDYPDTRDGYEVSRYIALAADGADAGSWCRGRPLNGVVSARPAMFDAGPAQNPIGVSVEGRVYWHELGHSADGQALPWFIQSADVYLDENNGALVRQAWPDLAEDQLGPVQLGVTSRLHPQGPQTAFGPYTLMPGQETVDFKASGRLFQLTYSGFSLPSYARIGRLVVDASPRGRKG